MRLNLFTAISSQKDSFMLAVCQPSCKIVQERGIIDGKR